jgi:hypothetical protein
MSELAGTVGAIAVSVVAGVVSGLVEVVGTASLEAGSVAVGVVLVAVTPVRVPIASPEPPPHAARATTRAASPTAVSAPLGSRICTGRSLLALVVSLA